MPALCWEEKTLISAGKGKDQELGRSEEGSRLGEEKLGIKKTTNTCSK